MDVLSVHHEDQFLPHVVGPLPPQPGVLPAPLAGVGDVWVGLRQGLCSVYGGKGLLILLEELLLITGPGRQESVRKIRRSPVLELAPALELGAPVPLHLVLQVLHRVLGLHILLIARSKDVPQFATRGEKEMLALVGVPRGQLVIPTNEDLTKKVKMEGSRKHLMCISRAARRSCRFT